MIRIALTTLIILTTCLLVGNRSLAQGQNTWTAKNDVGFYVPNGPQPRTDGISFVIGNKGYMGLGRSIYTLFNDFWEYDFTTHLWTRKANYPALLGGAIAFVIGNKGYVGAGSTGGAPFTGLNEYDPVTDTWTQKASLVPGVENAVAFSIGNKGYVATGLGTFVKSNKLFEYNPITDTWTQKADLPSDARDRAFCFTLNAKAYIGGGQPTSSGPLVLNDFWEYDPALNLWTTKGSLPAGAVSGAIACSSATKGYIGLGYNGTAFLNTFYEYDATLNNWTTKSSLQGKERMDALCILFGTKCYMGTGSIEPNGSSFVNDFWMYDIAVNSWSELPPFGGLVGENLSGFSIGGKVYVGVGFLLSGHEKEFWEFDPAFNLWTQKANYPGLATSSAAGFSIAGMGYIGTGINGTVYASDFWQYNPINNSWTQKASFGGGTRKYARGFSIGPKGYLGLGVPQLGAGSGVSDFWEYDPGADSWTQKTDFAGGPRSVAVGFSVGGKGYIGTGSSDDYCTTKKKDFWEYDPIADTWTIKSSIQHPPICTSTGFGLGGKGYMGTGSDQVPFTPWFDDFDPITNAWTPHAPFPGFRAGAIGISDNNKGYLGTGTNVYDRSDFWEYNPTPSIGINYIAPNALCNQNTFVIPYSAGGVYNNGNVFTAQVSDLNGSFANPTIVGLSATTTSGSILATLPSSLIPGNGYMIRVVSSSPATIGAASQFPIYVAPTPAIQVSNNTLNTSMYTSYQWYLNGVLIPGATSPTYIAVQNGSYTVAVTDSRGCTGTSSATIVSSLAIRGPVYTKDHLVVGPNPCTGNLVISGLDGRQLQISIADIDGRLVLIDKAKQLTSVNYLPPGIYILRVTDGKGELLFMNRLVKI